MEKTDLDNQMTVLQGAAMEEEGAQSINDEIEDLSNRFLKIVPILNFFLPILRTILRTKISAQELQSFVNYMNHMQSKYNNTFLIELLIYFTQKLI